MIIGNIVSNVNLNQEDNFKYYTFNDVILDNELPTIYVGYHEANNILGELDSLNRIINPKTYWTFSRNENNKFMINDIFNFKIDCHYFKVKDIVYFFITPFSDKKNNYKIIQFFKKIKNLRVCQMDNNMLYINSGNYIFGVDLNFMGFYGFNIENLLKKIKDKSDIFVTESELSEDIILFNEIIEDKKYSPFLL